MLSIPHLIVIFVVALVVFGPEKLPELARNLGKMMAEFKRATGDFRSTFEDHLRDLERETTERKIGGETNSSPTSSQAVPAAPAPKALESASEAAALPPAPGAVTADEPYLSRASTAAPDHALEDDPKIAPPAQPEPSSETVSDARKRPG
jgi:sec-independent protein translocase protein TatB